jgi:hypothetical protein
MARAIPVSLPGAYWLAPGRNELCVVAQAPGAPSVGAVCSSIDSALRHGIANTTIDPKTNTRTIVGVAPDKTQEVRVESAGSSTAVHVRNGVFILRDSVQEPPRTFILRR